MYDNIITNEGFVDYEMQMLRAIWTKRERYERERFQQRSN